MGSPPLIGVAGCHEQYVAGNGEGRAQAGAGRRTPIRAELIHNLPDAIDVPPIDEGRSRPLPVRWLEDDDIVTDDFDCPPVSALGSEGTENDRWE